MSDLTTEQMVDAEQLWALHVEGPDDMHAAPSKEIAERTRAKMQAYWDQLPHHPVDPILKFKVVPWPYSRESHATSLRFWSVYFGGEPE